MVKTLSEEEPSFTTVSKEELSERSAEVHSPACKDVLTIIFIYSNFDHQSNNYLLTQRCYQLTYRMQCIT